MALQVRPMRDFISNCLDTLRLEDRIAFRHAAASEEEGRSLGIAAMHRRFKLDDLGWLGPQA